MKLKVFSLAFALILFCSSIPLTVEAQANHSLEWGVDVDEEFKEEEKETEIETDSEITEKSDIE